MSKPGIFHGDIKCGYTSKAAARQVNGIPAEKVYRLAAMALTFDMSQWSDRERDLVRGIESVMDPEPSK